MKDVIKSTKKVLNYIGDSVEKFDRSQRYETRVVCYNCGYCGAALVLKGTVVEEGLRKISCPKCKCLTLGKVERK